MRVKIGGQYKVGVTWVKSGGTYETGNPLVKSGGQYKADQTKRWVYNFDGVDDYGVLQFRAINPDGDNTFEFFKPNNTPCTIIAQGVTSNGANREFQLWQGASAELNIVYGGVTTVGICTVAEGYTVGSKYFLTLIGTTATLAKDNSQNVIRTTTFTRGAAREPAAPTLVCCRGNDSGFSGFAAGPQYNLKINGVLWPIADRNQSIQLPVPSGLGVELISQAVLENPETADSNWSYLGAGRWQYIGDGTLNVLRFLAISAQPQAGYVEFEVESISGSMRCYSATGQVGVFQSNPIFTTTGVFRHYVTSRNGIAAGSGFLFQRQSTGVPASCVIKNISFKPLGSCNPLTLVNTNQDRWVEVSQ